MDLDSTRKVPRVSFHISIAIYSTLVDEGNNSTKSHDATEHGAAQGSSRAGRVGGTSGVGSMRRLSDNSCGHEARGAGTSTTGTGSRGGSSSGRSTASTGGTNLGSGNCVSGVDEGTDTPWDGWVSG